jgi:hypothetical protein
MVNLGLVVGFRGVGETVDAIERAGEHCVVCLVEAIHRFVL